MKFTPEMKLRRDREVWEDLHGEEYEEINYKNVLQTVVLTIVVLLGAVVVSCMVMLR